MKKNELLFNYLVKNPVFTIRDLVIWSIDKPFCFNCGHSAVRNLKKYIKHKGYVVQEKWIGKREYKEFKLVPINKNGQVRLIF